MVKKGFMVSLAIGRYVIDISNPEKVGWTRFCDDGKTVYAMVYVNMPVRRDSSPPAYS